MTYDEMDFKIPIECEDYEESSNYVVAQCEEIVRQAIDSGRNKILINTNLRLGLPMENINKVAGPFVEAWAYETFFDALNDGNNEFQLVNVEAQERLTMSDVILQFERQRKKSVSITAEVDVKATSIDIPSSGKSPNITSYGRIRTAYITDPDYLFIILSLKHRVYSKRNVETAWMDGIMEVVSHNAYDLKYLDAKDLNYNPALGTGQIQVKDIHYVALQKRTTWEFCQLLDKKFLASGKRSFDIWYRMAKQHGWVKTND
jgi:hypothetical protein